MVSNEFEKKASLLQTAVYASKIWLHVLFLLFLKALSVENFMERQPDRNSLAKTGRIQ